MESSMPARNAKSFLFHSKKGTLPLNLKSANFLDLKSLVLKSLLLVTSIACSTSALAQGALTDTEVDALSRISVSQPRGATMFSVPIPGETYSELSGAIGHRAVDMSISGNGLLRFDLVRKFEEIPNQSVCNGNDVAKYAVHHDGLYPT